MLKKIHCLILLSTLGINQSIFAPPRKLLTKQEIAEIRAKRAAVLKATQKAIATERAKKNAALSALRAQQLAAQRAAIAAAPAPAPLTDAQIIAQLEQQVRALQASATPHYDPPQSDSGRCVDRW